MFLRDCPFCGCPVEIATIPDSPFVRHVDSKSRCILSGCRYNNPATLAALWNHRAGLPDLPDESPSAGKGVTIEKENA